MITVEIEKSEYKFVEAPKPINSQSVNDYEFLVGDIIEDNGFMSHTPRGRLVVRKANYGKVNNGSEADEHGLIDIAHPDDLNSPTIYAFYARRFNLVGRPVPPVKL
jgi:hypothetical protein